MYNLEIVRGEHVGNRHAYMRKGNNMEKIIQRLLEKFQQNSEIGKVIVDEYDISFEEHPEMKFVLSEGIMRSFNPFNKNREIYCEGRLLLAIKGKCQFGLRIVRVQKSLLRLCMKW